jgi:hypothetical protein
MTVIQFMYKEKLVRLWGFVLNWNDDQGGATGLLPSPDSETVEHAGVIDEDFLRGLHRDLPIEP